MTKFDPNHQDSTNVDMFIFGLDNQSDKWLDHVRTAATSESLGSIGQYEIIREVSRGGQGVVYEARLPESSKKIALKRLVAGALATDSMRRRFNRELSAAAALNHPNIVTVIGMESVNGEPILAMEWVNGKPITQWARDRETTVAELIDVTIQLCDAVLHAHQRGVIHRDLKPSNILVDEAGNPRVLDFGLAKIAETEDLSPDGVTLTTDFVGTPAYASPEQLCNSRGMCDIRVDVYAIGMLLYELLTGRTAYPTDGSLADMLHQIRHSAPIRPSTISSCCDHELETVVLKAIAKDLGQRYQSVESLKSDLSRYRLGQPVLAHPPSSMYLARKFFHRHRTACIVSMVSFMAVVSSAIIAGVLGVAAIRAHEDESRARRVAERTSSFLQDMLASAQPRHHGGDVKVLSLLNETARRVEIHLSDDPEAAADTFRTIAQTYYSLWLANRSVPYWRKALALYRNLHGNNHESVASCLAGLGMSLSFMDAPEAIGVQQESLLINRTLYHEDDPRIARSILRLGFAYYRGTSPPAYDDAEACFLEVLQKTNELENTKNPNRADTLYTYAAMLSRQGRHEESLNRYTEAISLKRAMYGDESTPVLECRDDYAMALFRAERYDMVLVELKDTIALTRRLLGDGWAAASLSRSANTHQRLGQMREARRCHLHALRAYYTLLEYDAIQKVKSSAVVSDQPSMKENPMANDDELFAAITVIPIEAHISIALFSGILSSLAETLVETGETNMAITAANEALRLRLSDRPPNHWRIAQSTALLGYVQSYRNPTDESQAMIGENLAILEATRGMNSQEALTVRRYLVRLSARTQSTNQTIAG